MPMNVVVVESPAKAKTINKYLGSDYTVLASFGHVRDLPPKDGSVKPDEDFAMAWEIDTQSAKRVKAIADAVKEADRLILATDPDREGEAISWHLLEALQKRRVLKDVTIERVAFNAITKQAVQEAMRHPRAVDMELVNAYLARRALDYLVAPAPMPPSRRSRRPACRSPASRPSRPSATRRRPSPLRRCSRKPRASWASRRPAPCRPPRSSMRVSISAARRRA
jgi:hypothetical protein